MTLGVSKRLNFLQVHLKVAQITMQLLNYCYKVQQLRIL